MAKQARSNIYIDGTQAGTTIEELTRKYRKLNAELKKLPPDSDKYKKKLEELQPVSEALTHHRNEIKGISGAYGQAKEGLSGLLKQFAPGALLIGGFTAAIGGVVSGVRSWYVNNKELEKSLQSLKALTGVTKEELKFFREQAKSIGEETGTSATSIVEAFKLVGGARPDLLKNKEALAATTKEVTILAKAAEMEMAPAAQAVAGTMNQFNLSAEHSKRIINAFAAGSKEGAAEVTDLTESTEKFGTIAQANNVTLEESIALTEMMADKNIKGAEAGTQIRNVLLNVAAASTLPTDALKALDRYGVNLDIVTNKALPLNVRLKEMAKIQADQNALVEVFGKENVVAGQTILGNIEKFEKLTDAVTGTNTAYDQYADVTDTLQGDLDKLSSVWENFTTEGSSGSNILREAVQALTDGLRWVIKYSSEIATAGRIAIQTFVAWKVAVNGAKVVNFIFNGGLKEVAGNLFKLKDAAKDGAGGVKGLGGALKGVGWAAIASVVIEVARAIYDVASGAQMARHRLEQLQKFQEQGTKAGTEFSNKVRDNYNKELQEIEKLEAAKKISEKEANERRKQATRAAEEEIKTKVRSLNASRDEIKEKRKQAQADRDALKAKHSYITSGMEATKEYANSEVAVTKLLSTENAHNAMLTELNGTLKELNESQHQNAVSGLVLESQTKLEQKAAEDAQRAYEKLRDELDKLIEKRKELQSGVEMDAQLAQYEDGLNKELFLLQKNIEDKYAAEIELARKLMNEKGEIGIKAAEQYNALILLEDQDYEQQSKILKDKYAKEKKDADYEQQKEANLQAIAQQASLEDAMVEIKVGRARAARNAILEGDLSGQRKADRELRAALEEQLEHEKKRKLEGLLDQYDQGLIGQAEFQLRKEELEKQHLDRMAAMNQEAIDQQSQMDQQRLDKLQAAVDKAYGMISTIVQTQGNKQQNRLNAQHKKEVDALDKMLANKEITQEEYDKRKKALDEASEKRLDEHNQKQAKKEKDMALFKILLDTAIAVTKALASSAPPFNLIAAGVAAAQGAIQYGAVQNAPVPQYADGGFSDVTGAKDGKRYRARNIGRLRSGFTPSGAALALISEKGREYFVPNGLLKDRRVSSMVNTIEAIRNNSLPQYADGGFTNGGPVGTGYTGMLEELVREQTRVMGDLARKIPEMEAKFSGRTLKVIEDESAKLRNLRG